MYWAHNEQAADPWRKCGHDHGRTLVLADTSMCSLPDDEAAYDAACVAMVDTEQRRSQLKGLSEEKRAELKDAKKARSRGG